MASRIFESVIVAFLWVYPLFSVTRRIIIAQSPVRYVLRKRPKWVAVDMLFSAISFVCASFFVTVVVTGMQRGMDAYPQTTWLLLTGCVIFFGYFTIILAPWMSKLVVTDRGLCAPSVTALLEKVVSYQWFETRRKGESLLVVSVRCLGLVTIGMPLIGFTIDEGARKEIDGILAELKVARVRASRNER